MRPPIKLSAKKLSTQNIPEVQEITSPQEYIRDPNEISAIETVEDKYRSTDAVLYPNDDAQEILGLRQSKADKWANGTIRALGTAIGSASEIIAAPLDLTIGVINGDMASGPVGELFSDLNESLAEAAPIYYTKAQQEMGFLESLGTTNFWADKALNGAGYLAGAYFGGRGLGMLFKTLGKGAKAASTLNKVGLGTEATALGQQGSKLAKFANPAKQLAMAGFMAHGEAAVEARDVRDTMFDDLVAKRNAGDPFLAGKSDEELMDISVATGNTTYAFNLPIIAGSDVALFGKALFPDLRQTRKVLNTAGKLGEATAVEGSKLLGIGVDFGKGFLTEGGQELAQLGVSEGTKKFYLGQYSNSAREYSNLVSSIVGETINNLGTKEGLESIFLGGILGGPTSVFTSERGDNKKAADAYATFENSTVVPRLKRLFDNSAQTADASAMQDQYAAKNDKFGFKNEAYNVVKGLTKQAEETGGTDTLIDRFEALKGTDVEEFKRVFGYTEELTETERDNKVDQLVATVKDVSEKHKQIVDRNPQLNPALYPQNRPVFDAIFDAVTNFEDIDKREKDIASEIMGLTSTTDNKMVASIYGPYMKEYVKKGIDYEKFRNSDDYKEKYGNTVQEYIDSIKEENPDKAAKLETLSKDLYKLAERREEMIKQYNEAIEQPEKIQKEAEAAAQKVQEERDRLKAEADAQAAEALKAATEATPQPVQTPEEAANTPLTPEAMIGGTPGTVIEPMPVTGEIGQTNASLQEINDAIDALDEQLFYEESDGNVAQVEVINAQLKDLKAQKETLEKELADKIEEEDKAFKEAERERLAKAEEEKKKKEEEEAKKAATQKVVVPENKKEAIGFRTFGKLIPPTSAKDKAAAQKVLNTTPLKELLAGLTITISPYEGTDTVGEYVTWAASKVGITFSYKGTVLGYLPNPNKIIISATGQGWGDLSLADKQNYFKLDEPKGTPITFDMIDAERNNLLEIYKNLENKEGKFTLAQLPFLQVTPSLGEYLVLTEGFPTLAEIEDTYTVVKNNGELVIYDTALENTVNDNLPKKLPAIPEKLKKTNRYLLLVNNGYEQRWIAMQPTPLLKTEFADIYKDVLALQKRILAGETVSQEELDLANNAVKQKYFVAENRKDKKYTFASLSNKGTFTLREVSFKRGNKESDKVVDGKSGIKTIDKVYEELFKIGTIKGNEQTLRATVGFKNGGLKVTINKAEAEKVKAEEFVKEPVVTGDKIAEYRAAEEEEVKKIIPNIDDYKVGGVINKDKVLEGIEERKKEEIYNTVRKPVITELELSDEVDGSLISEHNTKEEVEAAYLEAVKVNAVKEKAIQAKYKAQADAYNEIYDRYDKLITEVAETKTEAPTKPLSKIEKAKAERLPLDGDDPMLSVSDIPATKLIQYNETVAYLKSILPFEVANIDAIAARLSNNGITFGAFMDNVIYLNKAAQTGTEYHEAFHGVMSLFSVEERAKYLEIAKKEHKITAKQRAEFKTQRPVYQNYSDAELDKILLEEYLADKFMAWKQGKKEPNGFFAKMFQRIKDFFNGIKDYFGGNLDALFYNIDSGKFKNRPISRGSKTPLFMALPYRKVKIAGTNDTSIKKLSSEEENNLLGSLQHLMVTEIVKGDLTIKQAFEKAVGIHYAKFAQAVEESALEGEAFTEYYEKNAGLLEQDYVKKALYEKLKSRIQFLLSIDQDIEDRILSKEETEVLRDYDKTASQVTGLPTLSQYVRLLIASSSVEVTDELGVTYRRALNPSTVYNGIERTLLNTKPDDFMKKLEVFSVYNSEVSHFVADLKEKLNWNSEANAPGLDNKGEVKNEHIWNAFQQAFYKFKTGSLMTRLNPATGEAKVSSSNFKDVDTQQVERWKVGFKNFMDKKYHTISMEPFISLKVTDGFSDEELEDAVREVKMSLDEIGIKLSPLYIQYSILKNKKELTPAQENLMELYENFYGLNGSDGETLRNIVGFVNEQLDPFKEGDEGALARLKNMAMENAYFDETAGTSTFQNAENQLVSDNQIGSFFLKRVAQLQNKQARSENQEEFTEFYSNQEDSWMVPLHFIATQDNPLYKEEVTFDRAFRFENIDGIRAEETTDEGKETGDKKEGVVFKNMTPLEKMLTFFSLYNTTKYKTVKVGKETKKIPYAYYYPQVIETASTGYAILLPVNPYLVGGKYSKEFYADMFSFIKNEHIRIKYLLDNKVPAVKNFTTGQKNGYKFFTNNYLSEAVQAELKSLATLDDISESLYNRIKEDIDKYVEKDFQLTMANLVKEGVVTLKKGEYVTGLLPSEFTDKNKVNLDKIRSMQLNYLVNGQAFNTLLHGDLAYKVKNPEDHVKRLKGANGAFNSMFGETVRVKIIPDIVKNKEVFVENGKKVFKEVEEATKKNEHNLADGQAYNSLDFTIRRLFKLGKTSPKVMAILSKVEEGLPLTREELESLEAADCLLNPKKDLAYGLNMYLKMSTLPLIRELTSYKVNGKWEALPGREKEHNILEDMLANNIDLVGHESVSKGTTIIDEVREINGDYYGEQVSTKGVKTKITDGTQHLALIWSELPHSLQNLVEQLDEKDQERIIQSTEYALSLLKDKDGVSTLSKVLPDWYDGLVATGASPQLLDIFRPNASGNPSLNPNIAISIDKFTAMYLAHWSNNALKQKVAGAKFTLVSPMKVIVHEGKVVRAEQFKANFEAYEGYDTRDLAWNTETTKDGKTILHSEAIVSSYYKELYGLKVGDEIPEDLAYMMGYRIPTDDKSSMTVLKIVDFLPAIYGNAIMVPEEVQFLSGADFDIDSLFVQKYDIYEKDGKFYKYGSATTTEGQFEEFINWAKKETDIESYQKSLLDDNKEYQSLLETEKDIKEQIEAKNEKLVEVNDFITTSLYEESEKEAIRSFVIDTKRSLIEQIKQVQERKKEVQANKLASALRYYGMPASKTAFKAKYPDGKFKAVLNNEMLSIKIEMLGNPTVQNTLAFEKTSNEILTEAEELLTKDFPEIFTAGKNSLGFFSFNDLSVAMANNDAGSDGIGPVAVFNVIYQYLAKVNATLAPNITFTTKSKDFVYKHVQFRGTSFKDTGRYTQGVKRIVRSISALINAMTDNAKDPVAGRLNLNLETLGPVCMMIGTGVPLKLALKIINSPKVKEVISEILNASSNFISETQYSIVQKAESEVAYLNAEENPLPLVEEQLDEYLRGKEEGDVANIALNVYLKARKASQYSMLAKDILNLRKGVPANFTEVDKIYKSYTTLSEALGGDIMGLGRILEVGPIKASTQALEELKSTATTLFISQNPKFKKTLAAVEQQTLGINKPDVASRLGKDFNSFVSLSIFRKYLEDTKAGKTKKYNAKFLDPFIQAFTKEALFETKLVKEVQNLQRNAKSLGLENNRFLRYISAKEREKKYQVDKIEGNTRQLRNPDYQEELINSFDDLYANPKSRDTAVKLVAYILLKDGARYKNNSFQSEIPAYMFTIYSDALDYFTKNPDFVDTTKIADEFIKIWSLNKSNSNTLYYLPAKVNGKENPVFSEGKKQGVFAQAPETITLNDTRAESKEGNMTNRVMANYNFKLVDKMYVPNPFIKSGYFPYVLQKVDGKVITDLSNIPSGTKFEYVSAEKAFGVTSLNAYSKGTSAYSFPLNEALELYGRKKNVKIESPSFGEEEDEWADVIDPRVESMSTTEDVSNSWIEQQQLEESQAKVVTKEEYKEIKEAETTSEDKVVSLVKSPMAQLASYFVKLNEDWTNEQEGIFSYEFTKGVDPRVEQLVTDAEQAGSITPTQLIKKIKEADTENIFNKTALC
jgi:DNA-binding transcriptional regulator YbjK